jgi:hypothetical protein
MTALCQDNQLSGICSPYFLSLGTPRSVETWGGDVLESKEARPSVYKKSHVLGTFLPGPTCIQEVEKQKDRFRKWRQSCRFMQKLTLERSPQPHAA